MPYSKWHSVGAPCGLTLPFSAARRQRDRAGGFGEHERRRAGRERLARFTRAFAFFVLGEQAEVVFGVLYEPASIVADTSLAVSPDPGSGVHGRLNGIAFARLAVFEVAFGFSADSG